MLIAKLPLNNKNATAYIRVSSQRQVDKGVSIDAQKRRIKEYAKFKGLNLDEKAGAWRAPRASAWTCC